MGRVASGDVDHEGEFLRCPELGDQPFKRVPQVDDGSLASVALAVRAYGCCNSERQRRGR